MGFIPQNLILRSTVFGWISIYRIGLLASFAWELRNVLAKLRYSTALLMLQCMHAPASGLVRKWNPALTWRVWLNFNISNWSITIFCLRVEKRSRQIALLYSSSNASAHACSCFCACAQIKSSLDKNTQITCNRTIIIYTLVCII